MPDRTPLLALYAVPADPHTLPPPQRSGAACVWCQYELRPGEGIDLGGTGDWRPHGCVPCCEIENHVVATYLDWHDHGIGCERCPLRPCARARDLRAAHLDAHNQAGRPEPSCAECRAGIAPGEPLRPHLWQGLNGPVPGYLHTRTCPAPGP
ncbi:hypothetical protein RB200_20675 [Streptomyces sp. PmtG]